MTRWEEFEFEERIRLILSESTYHRPDHHFGRPFLTPYQLQSNLNVSFRQTSRRLGCRSAGEVTDNVTHFLST